MQELPYSLMSELEKVKDNALPPVHLWHPEAEQVIDLVIEADGTWVHEGTPIKRRRLIRLFASVLRLDEDGYWLVTPVEKCRIQVVDAPFQGVLLEVVGSGEEQVMKLTTDMGEEVAIGAEHPLRIEVRGEEWIPYVLVRGGMEARLNRNVYYQLTELMVTAPDPATGRDSTGIYSSGVFFPLMQV